MRDRVFMVAGACLMSLVLSGCTSSSYQAYIKPGTSIDHTKRDQAECSVEANRLFPSANFPNTYPYGNVGYYGGGWGWGLGVVHTTDVNAGMRNQHRSDCMVLKGYNPVAFPFCTQDQLSRGSFSPLTRAPTPSGDICAVSTPNGGQALIDLSKPL